MRKLLLLLPALSLMFFIASCGKGTGTTDAGSSVVAVNVGGDGRSASIRTERYGFLSMARMLLAKAKFSASAEAAIPANVTDVAITIHSTAHDMPDIFRTVHVAGQTAITESFVVPNGNSRTITVNAKDATGTVLYTGARTVDLHGASVFISIPVVNVRPPLFAGIASATAVSPTEIDLTWAAATDNVTPAANMVYLVYAGTSPGTETLLATSQGTTAMAVTGLTPDTTYYFMVRTRNNQLLVDGNTVEMAAATPSAADSAPPLFAGIASAVADAEIPGQVNLSWAPATDVSSSTAVLPTPQDAIVYLIYTATTPGAENFIARASYVTAPGATTFPATALPLGTNYFVVRARDAFGNIDRNTRELTAATGSITATAGSGVSAVVGTILRPPLQATVRDAAGNPLSGVTVTFTAPTTGPSVIFAPATPEQSTTAITTTNAFGVASSPDMGVNNLPGPYTIVATAGALPPAVFRLTNVLVGGPAAITASTADSGTAILGVPKALHATVTDAGGTRLSGVSVIFNVEITPIFVAATPTYGFFSNGSTTFTTVTGADGVATATFTPFRDLGSYIITVTVANTNIRDAFAETNILPPIQ